MRQLSGRPAGAPIDHSARARCSPMVRRRPAPATSGPTGPISTPAAHEWERTPLGLGLSPVLVCAAATLVAAGHAVLAMLAQMLVMCLITFRSTLAEQKRVGSSHSPAWTAAALNAFRCVAGCAVLGTFEVQMHSIISCVISRTFMHAMCAYAGVSVADYMCHRFLWHAHWSLRPSLGLLDRWAFRLVRAHYIHHWLAHHKHTHDPAAESEMRLLRPVPITHKQHLRQRHHDAGLNDFMTDNALLCSDHGMTMSGFHCVLSYVLLHAFLPCFTMALWHVAFGTPEAAVLHLLSCILPTYLNIHHERYHASADTIQIVCESDGMVGRWLWGSAEFDRLSKDHMRHHLGQGDAKNRFWGVMPYNRIWNYFVWQQT